MKLPLIYFLSAIILFSTGYFLRPYLSEKNMHHLQGKTTSNLVEKLDYKNLLLDKKQQILMLKQQLKQLKSTQQQTENAKKPIKYCDHNSLKNGSIMTLADDFYYDRLNLLSSLTPFNKEEIQKFSSLQEFAGRLVEIGSGNAYEDQYLGNEYIYQPINISSNTTILENDNYLVPSEQEKIYANFDLPEGVHDNSVFVKWYNFTTKETLLLKRMSINPYDEKHNIWLSRPTGWEPGQYIVEIFTTNGEMNLIGATQFEVFHSE
jgi:hypothetical protein